MNILVKTIRWVRGLFGITPEMLDRNFHSRRQSAQIESYMQKNDVRRLQIGSQTHVYDTWLNTDLSPKSADIIFLDATQRFPIEDNSFNYIFSEHMIEHINYDDGKKMLAECLLLIGLNHLSDLVRRQNTLSLKMKRGVFLKIMAFRMSVTFLLGSIIMEWCLGKQGANDSERPCFSLTLLNKFFFEKFKI